MVGSDILSADQFIIVLLTEIIAMIYTIKRMLSYLNAEQWLT